MSTKRQAPSTVTPKGQDGRVVKPTGISNPHSMNAPQEGQRTVHYLGSKLRLLAPIHEALAEVVGVGSKVCDLFSGSGVVSLSLARSWNVLSVDIQEYSRVLCQGLMSVPSGSEAAGEQMVRRANVGSLRTGLRKALACLLDYEALCTDAALNGSPASLCDIQEYGSLFAFSQCAESVPPLLKEELLKAQQNLVELGLSSGPSTVITRHFGGVYFSWEQAIELDALLSEVHSLPSREKDHYLAVLLVVASDSVNTVGKQFAQPIKLRDSQGEPKAHLVKQTVRDRSVEVISGFQRKLRRFSLDTSMRGNHLAIRGDCQNILEDRKIKFNGVYADPPYTREHYSRYYHVLETMALHDDPEISTTKIRSGGRSRLSRGLYRADRHQSAFCIKSKAPLAFEHLFREVAARGIPLVLSYSPFKSGAGGQPRLLSVEQLVGLAETQFANVECRIVGGMAHNKFNKAAKNSKVEHHAEVLLVCKS